MKANIFVILFVFMCCHNWTQAASDPKSFYLQSKTACAQENGVTQDELLRVVKNDVPVVSENIKCFTHCFFNKLGIYDANGGINEIAAQPFVGIEYGQEKGQAAVKNCKALKGTDQCDQAWQIFKCFSLKAA